MSPVASLAAPIRSHDFTRRILEQPDMPVMIPAAYPGKKIVDPNVPELSIHST